MCIQTTAWVCVNDEEFKVMLHPTSSTLGWVMIFIPIGRLLHDGTPAIGATVANCMPTKPSDYTNLSNATFKAFILKHAITKEAEAGYDARLSMQWCCFFRARVFMWYSESNLRLGRDSWMHRSKRNEDATECCVVKYAAVTSVLRSHPDSQQNMNSINDARNRGLAFGCLPEGAGNDRYSEQYNEIQQMLELDDSVIDLILSKMNTTATTQEKFEAVHKNYRAIIIKTTKELCLVDPAEGSRGTIQSDDDDDQSEDELDFSTFEEEGPPPSKKMRPSNCFFDFSNPRQRWHMDRELRYRHVVLLDQDGCQHGAAACALH